MLGEFLQDLSVEFAYERGKWGIFNLELRRDAIWGSKNPADGLPFNVKKQIKVKSDSECKNLVEFVLDQLLKIR